MQWMSVSALCHNIEETVSTCAVLPPSPFLTEDVYHRILRFTNYEVALVNKSVLPTKIWLPLYGEK